MLNVWPIFVAGVEVGLVMAIVLAALVAFCLLPLLEKAAIPRHDRGDREPPRRI